MQDPIISNCLCLHLSRLTNTLHPMLKKVGELFEHIQALLLPYTSMGAPFAQAKKQMLVA